MRKYLVVLSVLFFIIVSAAYCRASEPVLSGEVTDGVRIIKVTAMKYKFDPDPVVVRAGDKVRLSVTSLDVEHGLAIAEFKVNLVIPAGKTESIEFLADKAGTFNINCSVYCGPGHSKMQGKLVVLN